MDFVQSLLFLDFGWIVLDFLDGMESGGLNLVRTAP